MRIGIAAVCLALSIATSACKVRQDNQSESKDVESVKKVTLVQGSDGQGGYVGFITCGEGFIDKVAKKSEFAVPWSKVSNLSYAEMEAVYCTQAIANETETGGGPGGNGGGTTPPPTTDGFAQVDPVVCKQQENVDLPAITEIKRVFVPASSTDSFENCVVFAEEFDKMMVKLVTLKKAIVDKRVRVYATESATAPFSYDEAGKKLTVAFRIAGKLADLITVGGKVIGGTGVTMHTFAGQSRYLWTARQGLGSWASAKAFCDGLGQPWMMPTADMLAAVASELTSAKLGQLVGSTSGYYQNVQVLNPASPTSPHFSVPGNSASSGAHDNMSNLCVIDVGA